MITFTISPYTVRGLAVLVFIAFFGILPSVPVNLRQLIISGLLIVCLYGTAHFAVEGDIFYTIYCFACIWGLLVEFSRCAAEVNNFKQMDG